MSRPSSNDPLRGRVALVTGAASNIGRACAIAMTDAGGRVLATDIDSSGLDATADRIRGAHGPGAVTTHVADLRTADAPAAIVDAAARAYGRLDIVVHAAVDHGRARIEDLTVEQWIAADAVNSRAAVFLTREAAPHLVAGGHGAIVLFSSVQARRGVVGQVCYGATKGAIEGITFHLAVELAARGVRVNAVSPCYVAPNPPPEHVELAAYPLGRFGRPEEIAATVVFLASDASSWTTGGVFEVGGGAHVVNPGLVAHEVAGPARATWRQRVRRIGGRIRR